MAVALSCVTKPVATAVPRTSFLTAVLPGELLVALADPSGCVTDPIVTAVLRTELLAAILTKIGLITDTLSTITAPTATAAAGGVGAVTALPALGALTAARLVQECPMAAAGRDAWPENQDSMQVKEDKKEKS